MMIDVNRIFGWAAPRIAAAAMVLALAQPAMAAGGQNGGRGGGGGSGGSGGGAEVGSGFGGAERGGNPGGDLRVHSGGRRGIGGYGAFYGGDRYYGGAYRGTGNDNRRYDCIRRGPTGIPLADVCD